MDVNQTRFHLLFGERDWVPLTAQGAPSLYWDRLRQNVTLQPLPPDAPPLLVEGPPRRTLDRDRAGNWYLLGAGGRSVLRVEPEGGAPAPFWPPGAHLGWPDETAASQPPQRWGALAVIAADLLVLAAPDPPGLLLIDLQEEAAVPLRWRGPFRPVDLTAAPDGGLYILDLAGQPRYWHLHPEMALPEPDGPQAPAPDFVPVRRRHRDGRAPAARRTEAVSFPLPGPDPRAIIALADGSVLLLYPQGLVRRFIGGDPAGEARLIAGPSIGGTPLDAMQIALGPGDTLYALAADGRQLAAYSILVSEQDLILAPQPRRFALTQPASAVYADPSGLFALVDHQILPVTEIRPPYERTGELITEPFDGRAPACVWHRLLVDGIVPPGTAVTIQTRAADHLNLLDQTDWQTEPTPYRRGDGAELPHWQPFSTTERLAPGAGTWETLLQQARGRYLQVRLSLVGTGRMTPEIRALRVWYPRFSYLAHYMPSVYHHDELSAAFLERFLANVEGIFTTLEERIAQAQTLFDPASVPAAYMDWLASWLGLVLDPAWAPSRRRLFLQHARRLFQARGTVPGLIWSLRLALEPAPTAAIFTESVRPYYGPLALGEPLPRWFRIIEHFALADAHSPPDPACPDFTLVGSDTAGAGAALRRAWVALLQRRYRRPEHCPRPDGAAPYSSFADVPLPGTAENHGPAWQETLAQWRHAVGRLQAAHRFTVWVHSEGGGVQADLAQRQRVSRVVEASRPAHTAFDVQTYRMGWDGPIELRLPTDHAEQKGASE